MGAGAWTFIAAEIVGPGMDGTKATWATASLDLNSGSILLAADGMAREFSIWDFPSRERSYFDNDVDRKAIDYAKKCVG